ncbi:MAG: hypothetical protein KKG14_08570 [Alphaproteobacteria bacterium]|nr:hypothetical protein [Alphaproteobacteria bacterium]MBU2272526.1 hypothetical protein [Alphaproteobacteria bacterium]MBU2418743.1 hypothetical protein [Alphaproteobacteria bacterium]
MTIYNPDPAPWVRSTVGACAVFAAIALGASATVAAPRADPEGDAWLTETFRELERRQPELSAIESYRVDLAEGRRSRFTFNARAGSVYLVVGLCADNCTNLDIEVFAGSSSVGSDVLPDQLPTFGFVATTSGPHTVEVAMTACTAAACRAGAKVYVR